jgi:hypothetical protein
MKEFPGDREKHSADNYDEVNRYINAKFLFSKDDMLLVWNSYFTNCVQCIRSSFGEKKKAMIKF